jgi:large subunit ribosomal protein L18e
MASKTAIKKRAANKENPETKKLVTLLQKQKDNIWHDVAKHIVRPKRRAVAVNIEKINKISKDSEIIIVPGKVMNKGSLNHNIVLIALKYSQGAKDKLAKKANMMSIQDFIEKKSAFKGINMRIIT